MSKRKNRVELSKFKGMSWDNVCRHVREKGIVMTMSKDWAVFEAGKASDMCDGEAGASIIVSGLCMKYWNAQRTAAKAIEIYDGIKKRCGLGDMEHLFSEMQYWSAWMIGSAGKKKWPVNIPEWENDDKWGGLANVMLHMSASEMFEEGGNTNLLAARAITMFLKTGMENKEKAHAGV